MSKIYDGKKPKKLGSDKRPAALCVQTEEKKTELEAECRKNGWECDIAVDGDAPENLSDLEVLRNPISPVSVAVKPARNEPCTCGSGKKYKKCCALK